MANNLFFSCSVINTLSNKEEHFSTFQTSAISYTQNIEPGTTDTSCPSWNSFPAVSEIIANLTSIQLKTLGGRKADSLQRLLIINTSVCVCVCQGVLIYTNVCSLHIEEISRCCSNSYFFLCDF